MQVNLTGGLFGFPGGDLEEVRTVEELIPKLTEMLEDAGRGLAVLKVLHQMEGPDLRGGSVLGSVCLVELFRLRLANGVVPVQDIGNQLFQAESGRDLFPEGVALLLQHFPGGSVFTIAFDGLSQLFPDLCFRNLRETSIGFLRDENGMGHLPFRFLAEFRIALAAGDL